MDRRASPPRAYRSIGSVHGGHMPQLASRASHLENGCMNPGTSHSAVALVGALVAADLAAEHLRGVFHGMP